MRSSPALVAIDDSHDGDPSSVEESIRSLVVLVARASDRQTPVPPTSGSSSEEILVDVRVDGYRYLLVRMPLLDQNVIRLSPREQEIVRMVAKGHPNKVIADVLNISSWTVCTHLRRIFAKLGVGSRAAMVAQLLVMGVVQPERNVRPRVS